jgi:hypothetical protein
MVLAAKVLRTVHDDHHDRRHYCQPDIEQKGQRHLAPEAFEEERDRKVERRVDQDHQQKAPPVLLYTQVRMTLSAMVETTNRGKRLRGRKACPVKYSGR